MKMSRGVSSPERSEHQRFTINPIFGISIIIISSLIISILLARCSMTLLSKAAITMVEPTVTAHTALKALNERNLPLLQSSLSPQLRRQAHSLTADWERVTKDLGSVRSFGKFVGSICIESHRGTYQLVSQVSSNVEFERGSIVVSFVLFYINGKWHIVSIKFSNKYLVNG